MSNEDTIRIYTGILGQIGDIIAFTPTARRIRQLFPGTEVTFAISKPYQEMASLLIGLSFVDRVFITENYFERLTPRLVQHWDAGWPIDLRGDDEVQEQRAHQFVFETRPRHTRSDWWRATHLVDQLAKNVGVGGPVGHDTEISIPPETRIEPELAGAIVIHNDPALDPAKAWSWPSVGHLVESLQRGATAGTPIVLVGRPGPPVPHVIDLRGSTCLAEAAALIRDARCYIGIDSGLMWMAGSLETPTVGLYGTAHLPSWHAVQPDNRNATYIQAEGTLEQITPEQVATAVRHRIRLMDGNPEGMACTIRVAAAS